MRTDQKFNARKKELISKVTDLIIKNGYENLTVRGVCHDLGISTGTFYHYFPNKNDLAWILFSDIDNYFDHDVVLIFNENESANLITYCIEYAKYVMKNGVETCRCISIEPLVKLNHTYLDEDRSIFQVLLNIINRGIEKNQFYLEISPLETARMLIILLRGYSSDWAKRNGKYDLEAAIKTFAELFSKSLCTNISK